MNRVDALFGDEAMGYTAPVAKGAALGYPEQQHSGFTDLLGFREKMGGMSLEDKRYLQMGGAMPGAPMKEEPRQSRVNRLNYMGKMTLPQSNMFNGDSNAKSIGNLGTEQRGEMPRGLQTPQSKATMSRVFGLSGILPGQETAPPAPRKQSGGRRRTIKKSRKSRKSRSRRTQKSLINLRVTGRIQMKQRHRQ